MKSDERTFRVSETQIQMVCEPALYAILLGIVPYYFYTCGIHLLHQYCKQDGCGFGVAGFLTCAHQ